jgi:hypothetical protein
MTRRSALLGFVFATILLLGTASAGGRGAHSARAARPSDLLPKPPSCKAKNAKAEFCVLVSPFGTLMLTPHIVRPGRVLTARIADFNCNNVAPVPGLCAVSWPANRPGGCGAHSPGGVPCTVGAWMKRISRCGPQDHICSWRISRRATTTRYGIVGVSISRGGSLSEDVAQTSDYLGILGAKPPPALPKQSAPSPVEQPVLPPPVFPPPHH